MPRRTLPQLCSERPLGTLALIAVVLVAGWLAFQRLPISLMPDIVYPMVRVQVAAGQTPPEVMLQRVTRILEQELTQAEGIELIESATQQGQTQITISFDPSRDVDAALRDTATWVDRAKGKLPDDLEPPILFKFDPQNLPVMEFALSSSALDPAALRQLGEHDLAYRFVGVPGVSAVRAAGGRVREVQVRVDPLKLRGFGLTLADLASALKSENLQAPAGRIDAAGKELAGQVLSLFGSAAEIAELRLPLPAAGGTVRVADVATVLDTHREQRLIVSVNGEEAVKLSVFKAPQANSVEVAAAVRARLKELREARAIPAGVNLEITADESIYIQNSIAGAQHALYVAMALVTLVVLLFLGDWKFTLLSLSVLPVGLLGTVLLMKSFGLSLNLMSIGGLIMGVTLMVDYGIVLLENIARHWAAGARRGEAVSTAAREVSGALLASLAALIAAVTPFLFLGGISLLFFKEFILTIIFATSAGLLAAFALIPALWPAVSRFISHEAPEGKVMRATSAGYRRVLDGCLAQPRWAVAAAALVLAGGVWGMLQLGYVFLPEIDDGRVTVTVQGEPGTLLSELLPQIEAVEALAARQKEVALVDATTGGRIGQTVQEIPAQAELLIQLVPKAQRALGVNEWIAGFDKQLRGSNLVGVKVRAKKARIRAIRTFKGQAASGDFDVVVNIEGQDPATLGELGGKVREQLAGIAGLNDLTSTLVLTQPLVNFQLDRRRAEAFGISPSAVAEAIAAAISGAVPSRLLEAGLYHDIRVMNDRRSLHGHLLDLAAMPLRRLDNGDMLLLGQVAELRMDKGPLAIDRVNQATVNMVNGTVRGRTLGEVAADVRAAMGTMTLPAGYTVSYGGRMATLDSGGEGMGRVGLLALFLIVVVLAVQYESLLNPLLIVGVLPVGLGGSVLALWIAGAPLSTTVIIGFILLVGIAANNAIVLVAYIEQLRAQGRPLREAIREGATARLRPKLMTAAVAIAGLAPLATGSQEGGEILQPLALAVIGGMPLSLLATLLILPTAYFAIHRRRERAFVTASASPHFAAPLST